METTDIVISYETLFELLRIERSRNELQRLPVSFYEDVQTFLSQERSSIASSQLDDEKRKKEISLKTVMKILHEFYDRRERKIAHLALSKSKTPSVLIDPAHFLPPEKKMYDSLLSLLNSSRANFKSSMDGEEKKANNLVVEPEAKEQVSASEEKPAAEEKKIETTEEKSKEEVKTQVNTPELKEEENQDSLKLIRFIRPFPSFLGLDLESYGPYEEHDVANLPVPIAELLIRKKRAQEIRVDG